MATPLLVDTDMGVDDAVAIALALASDRFDVRAIVGVGGCVEIEQVMRNIGGFLAALNPPTMPAIGRGLEGGSEPLDRRAIFGQDGLGECGIPSANAPTAVEFRELYRRTIEESRGELILLTTGPLSNFAAICREMPDLLKSVKHVYVAGAALWTQGNTGGVAEFNCRRDPPAAAAAFSSRRPTTVAPLDVSRFISLDESHLARLAASGYRTGEVLAKMLRYPLEQDADPGYGRTAIHAAVAAGGMLWPTLFMKTRMRIDVVTTGRDAGRSKPALGGDTSLQVDLLTAVNAAEFIQNLLESLNHEAFVV
jgi:pyrimidine-specific ribonucleoside hydrolase